MTRIKICGITNEEDARWAAECGADAVGFVFAESPRMMAPDRVSEIMAEVEPFVVGVGVFVDTPARKVKNILASTGCSVAQLHGDESENDIDMLAPYAVVKVARVRDQLDEASLRGYKKAKAILLDTYVPGKAGGTGQRFDLSVAVELVEKGWRVIVAGGLTPENVSEVVKSVRPYGVDVSSGVEVEPGRKDPEKVAGFIAAVRAADREMC